MKKRTRDFTLEKQTDTHPLPSSDRSHCQEGDSGDLRPAASWGVRRKENHAQPGSQGTRRPGGEHSYFERNLFFHAGGLGDGVNRVVNRRCCRPGLGVPLTEHRLSFLRARGVQNRDGALASTQSQLHWPVKESACPSKLWSQARTSLSLAAVKADGIFFQRKEGRSALFFSAATFVHRLSWIFRAVCCLPLHFRGMEVASSCKPLEPTSASLELSFCRLLPSQPSQTEES